MKKTKVVWVTKTDTGEEFITYPQFPHCDSKILHAPEDNCKYCNMHPEWQALRQVWGIAFTGHSNEKIKYTNWDGKVIEKTLIPCPSEQIRPLENINKWPGNRIFNKE